MLPYIIFKATSSSGPSTGPSLPKPIPVPAKFAAASPILPKGKAVPNVGPSKSGYTGTAVSSFCSPPAQKKARGSAAMATGAASSGLGVNHNL